MTFLGSLAGERVKGFFIEWRMIQRQLHYQKLSPPWVISYESQDHGTLCKSFRQQSRSWSSLLSRLLLGESDLFQPMTFGVTSSMGMLFSA